MSDDKFPEMTVIEDQKSRSKIYKFAISDYLTFGPIPAVLLFFFF